MFIQTIYPKLSAYVIITMYNDNLLATYALLSFIRESKSDDKRDSLLEIYIPLVKEAIVEKLKVNKGKEYKGKDFSEIKQWIKNQFEFDIPIPALQVILRKLSDEVGFGFQIFGDNGFIIHPGCESGLSHDYNLKKKEIETLKSNYKTFCKGLGVHYDFNELVDFIQDQRNRIFKGKVTVIDTQNYHVSKYVHDLIKRKDKFFHIICSIYLGGVIGSYFEFQIRKPIFGVDLLIDTNFYISLVDLNTEESYDTCRQLFDITVPLGFHYYILESTIDQIKILLSNRISRINSKAFVSSVDEADILSACNRRGLSREDLEAYKDNLEDNLRQIGITKIYKTQVRELIIGAEKNKDLKKLTGLRGSRDSAINDLVAYGYIAKKREGKPITEFNDVNCWFLTNSFSFNKRELSIPVWQRNSITASDLLMLLWLSNPSQHLLKNKNTLAITSLSANVLKFRADKSPAHNVIDKIQDRVASLKLQGQIDDHNIAKLCIRMSEGCIDNVAANRMLKMPTHEFLNSIELMDKREQEYLEGKAENEELKNKNSELERILLIKQAENELYKMRLYGVGYLFLVLIIFGFYKYFVEDALFHLFTYQKYVIDLLYFIITFTMAGIIRHQYCIDGIISFFQKRKILDKISLVQEVKQNDNIAEDK